MSWRGSFGWTIGSELVAEGVETADPQLAAFGDPGLGGVHRRRLQPAAAHTPPLLAPDETAPFEGAQVLLDRRQRHVERRCQLTERRRAPAEPVEHSTPARIGERMEEAVPVRIRKLKHLLQY